MKSRLLPLSLLLACGLLLSTRAVAQETPSVSVHAFSGKALLGHGDHTGTYQGGTLMRQFHPLGFVGLTAGVINSSDLNFRPEATNQWRHRQLYLVEMMVHFDVVTIRLSDAVANRFSFRMGSSYQYGHEETPIDVTGPGLESRLPASMPQFLLEDAPLYVYRLDGKQYEVRSIERTADAFGTLMALEYSVEAGPVLLALHGAYRHYPKGTPLLTYGVSLGVRY